MDMMRSKGEDGYFTMEAAMIMPIVLVTILVVLQVWFYKYNRVLQEMDTDAVLIRALEMQDMNGEEKAEYVICEMQNRYKDKYIGWDFGDISVKCTPESIECTISGSLGYDPDPTGLFRISLQNEAVCLRSAGALPEMFVIRSYRKLLAAGKELSEQVKEE